MWLADGWKDYEVIDCSKGEKLERWGDYLLVRPDPQVIWDTPKKHKGWKKMNGHYHRSSKGGGEWEFFDLPEQWTINYKELTFNLKPFSFKHTGLFPEQAANWDWFGDKIRKAGRPVKVLNLFAYTGGATLAAAEAGASVTHIDASKGMVTWAKENAHSSGLSDAPIRWIVDDCVKFVEREIRRGNHYDAIIMDPPSYGRGPKGEIWKIEDAIHPLVKLCVQLLSDDPLFFLINSYTTGLAPSVLSYMMGVEIVPKFGGTVKAEEVHTRGVAAMSGTFGYELNPALLNAKEKAEIRAQLAQYREYQELIREGDYYRLSNPFQDNFAAWMVVSDDRSKALVSVIRLTAEANPPAAYVTLKGMEEDAFYREKTTGKVYPGAALMEAGILLPAAVSEYEAYQIELERV